MRFPGGRHPLPPTLPSETMLPLDLARLSREGSQRVRGEIPADAPLWEGTGIQLQGPLTVDLKAAESGSGEIVVRGRVEGTLDQQCRRCLEPVAVPLREEVTLVFAPPDVLGGDDEGEIRVLPADQRLVDLAEPIREEVILAAPPYVLCRPECRGLCPHCGTDLNETTCECAVEEPDPRWDALRALKNE
jgi:uncharacterized protein